MPELSSTWRERIEQAVALQDKQHQRWNEAQQMVLGQWPLGLASAILDPDFTPVNYATAYIRTVLASLYSRNPEFFVTARHRRYADFARSMQLVLNYLKTELDLKSQVKRCITDAIIIGHGFVETGYTATFESLELSPQSEEGMFRKLLKPFKRPAEQGVLSEFVKEVAAYTVRLSPWKVYLAPGYHLVSEMPYLLIAEDISPEDLKNHPLYAKVFELGSVPPTRRVEGGKTVSTPGMSRGFGVPQDSGPSELSMARVYHVWDRRNRERFLHLEGTQQVSTPFKWNDSFDGFRQAQLVFNDLPETNKTANSYPMSDITFMIPQLRELSLLRTQMVKHRKRSGTVILAQKNALTEEQAKALQASEDLTLVLINGTPSTDVANFQPAALPPDVYKVGDRILADLDLIGQLGFLLPTIDPKSERTATEATFRAQGAGTLRSEKVDVIEDFMAQVGRRLAAIAWEYYPRSLIQAILGEEQLPEELWPTLPDGLEARREMIERELEFTIEAGSTQPLKDKTLKNEQKLRLINILAGIAPERLKITAEGLGDLVQDFEMPELEKWMLLDDEQEQQVAMKENQLLAQNIPQLVSPNELHQVHEQVHAQLVLSGQSTPAAEQHLLQHRQFREAKQPKNKARPDEMGATRGAATSGKALRQGTPDLNDLLGPMTRSQTEPGQEKGGMANV